MSTEEKRQDRGVPWIARVAKAATVPMLTDIHMQPSRIVLVASHQGHREMYERADPKQRGDLAESAW